jgi:hydrogenase 3 maturation protease
MNVKRDFMGLNLKMLLKAALAGAHRVAVLGVGSELRGDDQAGLLVIQKLRKRCKVDGSCPGIGLFHGATAPENLTGEIKAYRPSHLILIDAADVGKAPGTVEIIDPELISGMAFSTHRMPLQILVDYMRESIDCKVIVIGIQPKTVEYDGAVSPETRASVREVATAIETIVREISHSQVESSGLGVLDETGC